MPKLKELWDKIMPLPIGARVRYVKNECKVEFKRLQWFQAREKNMGNEGVVVAFHSSQAFVHSQLHHYFRYLKNKNLYTVHFDRPVGDFVDFFCTREELEVI